MSRRSRNLRGFTQWMASEYRDDYHEEAQEAPTHEAPTHEHIGFTQINHPGNDGLSVDDIDNDSDQSRINFRDLMEEISLSSSSISPAATQDANVQAYKRMKGNTTIGLATAFENARRVQKRFPKKLVCGGLALFLYGVIKRNTFSDIDFVAFEKNVIPKEYISLKCSKPNNHCLFLTADVKEGKTIEGLKLQDLDQIIYWKTQFGRPRDKKDLQAYLDSQFIKEDEFIINL